MHQNERYEPWLRGTFSEIHPVQRAVLHALQLAREDLYRWCGNMTDGELSARPGGIEPLCFHLRHISRSMDRLLTYAEGRALDDKQLIDLRSEMKAEGTRDLLFAELDSALEDSSARIRAFSPAQFGEPRIIGKKELPTTVAGILVHIADHTQRHVGQAVTTSKIIAAQRA